MFFINLLLEVYPERMDISDLLGLIGGTVSEIKGYLLDGSLRGALIEGQWSIERADVGDFIKAHQHQSGAAADIETSDSMFRAIVQASGFSLPSVNAGPALTR